MSFNLSKKLPLLFAVASLTSTVAQAQTTTEESGFRALLNDPMAWGFAIAVFFLIIALIALNKALNTVRYITQQAQQTVAAAAGTEAAKEVYQPKTLMQTLTDAKPVEREADILLDHDYDGIHELDNNLPPWWVWGFYATIAYAVVYLAIHVTGDALNTKLEYDREMAAAKEKVDAYLATSANAVDENNVVALADAADLDAGAKIFAENCAACHLADGGGSVGPNLTDAYWIHGGGIKNVFTTIKYGVPAKGMISWKDQLGPLKMQQVASYVLSLQGTTPANPKAAEGDLWTDAAASPEAAPADSTQTEPAAMETTTTTETETQETTTTTATTE